MTGETLEEKIRAHAPGTAAGYYLIRHRKDKEPMRYPEEGAFHLKPFAPPSGAPFGSYLLYFVRYETDKHAMAPVNAAEDFVRIQLSPPGRSTGHQAGSEVLRTADLEPDDGDETDIDCDASPAERMADLEVAIASTPAMITARADFEKQRMAMELAENNQELLNKGHFSRDAAEALALNRAYRREVQVAIEAQANLARRTADEVQSHWTAFRAAQEAQTEGMRLLKEQLEMFAKPPQPPPPIDYVPAVIEGLKSLRDFGVALVQARAGVPFASPPAAPASLPSHLPSANMVSVAPPEATDKTKEAVAKTPATSNDTPAKAAATSARVPDAEGDVLATCTDTEAALAPPRVTAVTPVTAPSVTGVSGVIDPASADAKAEAARLLKAIAETSELEAAMAFLGPEHLQAFLRNLRQRAAQSNDQGTPIKK